MLSFPAANWEKARAVMKPSPDAARNAGFGRLASRITPRLYLSDYFTASDPEKLASHGITHVISVVDFKPTLPPIIEPDHILHIPVLDKSDADILQYFDRTTEFIKQALEENETNKVLVHCLQGISRSATVVCAYLVATTELTAIESISHVQSIRGIVCPNLGFRHQLDEYSVRYVKDKPKPAQLPEVLKLTLTSGIAARIKKLKEASKRKRL